MSLYDVPRLKRVMGTFGIDLAPVWNDDDFAAAALADVDAWVKWHQPKDKHLAEYRATLAEVGLVWTG